MPDAAQPDRQIVPPSDLDSEAAVLSACIMDPARVSQVSFLQPMHFYSVANGRVYDAIQDLDASGQTIDIVSVASSLRDRGVIDQVGGTPYLAQLADATPAVAHIEQHAKRVLREYDRRRIITECRRIAAETYGDIGDIEDWKQSVDARIQSITQSTDPDKHLQLVSETARAALKVVHERRQHRGVVITGLSTGLPTLDARIGGLEESKVYVFAARPGAGKTAVATGIVLSAVKLSPGKEQAGAVFISVEMPAQQITFRMLSLISRIDSVKIQRGRLTQDEFDQVHEAAEKLAKLPIAIEDSSDHSPASIRAAYRQGQRRLQEKFGKELRVKLVGIDYLQLLGSNSVSQNRENEIGQISRACKALAKHEKIAVLSLAQVNRDCEKRPDKRPILADLRESGAIEQDADVVTFIYREDMYRKEGEAKDDKAELVVRKLRDNGGPGTVHVEFDPATMTFFEQSRDPDIEQLGDMFDDYLPGSYNETDDPPRSWQDQYDK